MSYKVKQSTDAVYIMLAQKAQKKTLSTTNQEYIFEQNELLFNATTREHDNGIVMARIMENYKINIKNINFIFNSHCMVFIRDNQVLMVNPEDVEFVNM